IVDTAKYHFLAWQKIADSLGIAFTPEHNEALKGVSRVRSLDLILELGHATATQADKDRWLHEKNQDYLAYIENMDHTEILPGVVHVLKHLRENSQPIALGSASKNARPILEKTGILSYFDVIIDGNDVTNAKPDPEVFLQAAKQCNIEPADAIVFEDSVAGIEAANAGGMTSVGIGSDEVLHKAQYIFPDFVHIDLSFIDMLMKK
ncbi:MAG: beta-phosphoglucomutase, partial [Chitinophagaceae bacterium]